MIVVLNISNKRCGFLIHLISNFAGKQVLGGIYGGNISGVTAQHLEWVSLSLSNSLCVTHIAQRTDNIINEKFATFLQLS